MRSAHVHLLWAGLNILAAGLPIPTAKARHEQAYYRLDDGGLRAHQDPPRWHHYPGPRSWDLPDQWRSHGLGIGSWLQAHRYSCPLQVSTRVRRSRGWLEVGCTNSNLQSHSSHTQLGLATPTFHETTPISKEHYKSPLRCSLLTS